MSVDAWNNDWDVMYPFSAVSVESVDPSDQDRPSPNLSQR